MSNRKDVSGAMLSVTGIVILGKVFGFFKQMVTASAFGATHHTDVISLAEGIVTDLDFIVVQALITAFIPTYIHLKAKGEGKEKSFVSNTIVVFLSASIIISVALVLLSRFLATIIAPSYGARELDELTCYIRMVAPAFAIIVQMALYNALLKANEQFIPGELNGFIQSITLILLVFVIGSDFGADTLVIGFYAYSFFYLGYLMYFSKTFWCLELSKPFADTNVKTLLLMMTPLILGYSMVFVNQQVDKIIVSGLGEGVITAMAYAAVLSNFVCTFIGSISSVLFTYITKNIAEENDEKAALLLNQSSTQMITLLLPISILTVMNSQYIVSLVFGHGKFTGDAIINCSLALAGYGFMFIPYVLRELFSKFQYGYGDSKRPMTNSMIAVAINILLSIVLSKFLGILGVTLATSISVLISAFLNIVSSKRKNSYIVTGRIFEYSPRWIFGGLICIMLSLFGNKFITINHGLIRLTSVFLLSLTGYLVITYPILIPLARRLLKRKAE